MARMVSNKIIHYEVEYTTAYRSSISNWAILQNSENEVCFKI